MSESKKQTYVRGAAILAATAVIAKILSAVFKIPLANLLGEEGMGHFQAAYQVYTLFLTLATVGITIALSRLISAAVATGRNRLAKRYFSVALPAFAVIGAVFAGIMFFFADALAQFISNPEIAPGIRVLAPAIFFVCVMAVYEGYTQGHQNMAPTATKQLLEVTCKLVVGLAIAGYLINRGASSAAAAAGATGGVTVGLGIALPIVIIFKKRIDKKLHRQSRLSAGEDSGGTLQILYNIFKVSIPITLGSTLINVLTLIDTKFVIKRLQEGAGFLQKEAIALYGVYSMCLPLFVLPAALIGPVTVSIVPAISGALAAGRTKEAKDITLSSLKLTNLFAMPMAIGMFVLANPIFAVMYRGNNPIGAPLLSVFAIASYFSCMQLMSTAILQANGHEKIPLLTLPIGGAIQIMMDWYLVGSPKIGIIGSAFGTLTCYLIISVLNFAFIGAKVKNKPNFLPAFIKPALCTAIMGVSAWAVYGLLVRALSGALGEGRLAQLVYLVVTIAVAVVVYGVLAIATKPITRDDMRFLPKGEKLAHILRIK